MMSLARCAAKPLPIPPKSSVIPSRSKVIPRDGTSSRTCCQPTRARASSIAASSGSTPRARAARQTCTIGAMVGSKRPCVEPAISMARAEASKRRSLATVVTPAVRGRRLRSLDACQSLSAPSQARTSPIAARAAVSRVGASVAATVMVTSTPIATSLKLSTSDRSTGLGCVQAADSTAITIGARPRRGMAQSGSSGLAARIARSSARRSNRMSMSSGSNARPRSERIWSSTRSSGHAGL